MESPIALVLGITGGIGGEVARVLVQRGWHVQALHRNPAALQLPVELRGHVEIVRGDSMQRRDVVAAATGASVIIHGVNPPRYNNWRGLALPMLENTIAAARSSSARIVFPGTIYNFGPDAFPVLSETSAQKPLTRKGQIRVEMEELLRAASAQGVRSLIVRAGDYFGPRKGNNWFSEGLLGGSKSVKRVFYPGPRQLGHSLAYLPDLAETMVRLLEREQTLGTFEVFHFRGHWLEQGVEMARSVCRAAGLAPRKIHSFPWFAVVLAAPFVEVCREMLEMRYLWKQPLELDNSTLVAAIGAEPRTSLDEAVAATLRGVTAC
jgi:nucleoside-diphosphate-sugar epimerase